MWKNAQHCILLEKCKSKLQGDITSHQWKCLPSKSLWITNAGEGFEKREPCYTFGGDINLYSPSGEEYGCFFKKKKKIELPYDPAYEPWDYEPCRVGPPKTDVSWWRFLTKCGPVKKGIAKHFSILALRIPWTVWKDKKDTERWTPQVIRCPICYWRSVEK